MADYLGKMHVLLHEFNELLPLAQELEQRSKFFMVLTLHGLTDKYSHTRGQILGSLLYPILLLFVPSSCLCHVNLSIIHLFLPMIPPLWHLNMMIVIALASQEIGIPSVTIMAN